MVYENTRKMKYNKSPDMILLGFVFLAGNIVLVYILAFKFDKAYVLFYKKLESRGT